MEKYELTISPIEISKEISNKSQDKHELDEIRGVMPNTYDINYSIKLLKVILEQCYQHRLNPNQLYYTMDMSLKKMIRHLEKEKSQM